MDEHAGMTLDAAPGAAVLDEKLDAFVQRIVRLNEEKRARLADISEVLKEAKGEGYNVKLIRRLVAIVEADEKQRRLEEAELETYKSAIGIR